jgi:glycogen operon protein
MDEQGQPIVGDTLLLLLNAHHEAIPFTLPEHVAEGIWEPVLDTTSEATGTVPLGAGDVYPLQGRSMAVLRSPKKEAEE